MSGTQNTRKTQDRPKRTLDDVYAGLEELNGHLAATDALLRAQIAELRTFIEGQIRTKTKARE